MLFGVAAGSAQEHRHGGAGSVQFPVSCSAPAKDTFQHGVALLHSFWYDEAEKTFRQAAVLDPACAMAWWGVAMSRYHPLWAAPARADLEAGSAAVEKAKSARARTPREADYIQAVEAFYRNWETCGAQKPGCRMVEGHATACGAIPGRSRSVDLLRSVVNCDVSRG